MQPAADDGLCLLIDIDNTVIRQAAPPTVERGHALLALMRDKALQHGADASDIDRSLDDVMATTWWSWGDFLDRLDLPHAAFWRDADRLESQRTTPIDPGLADRARRLRHLGCRLYVTSNNPADGIAHKLRLAGMTRHAQRELFDGMFGTDRVMAIKAEPAFWTRVLDELGVARDRVVVIGDHPQEDGEVPASVGIEHRLRIETDECAASSWAEAERAVRALLASMPVGGGV